MVSHDYKELDTMDNALASPAKRSKAAFVGGSLAAGFFALCCAGMLALLGVGSLVVTLGAWRLDLVSDAVLFPLLGLSVLVALIGYHHQTRSSAAGADACGCTPNTKERSP